MSRRDYVQICDWTRRRTDGLWQRHGDALLAAGFGLLGYFIGLRAAKLLGLGSGLLAMLVVGGVLGVTVVAVNRALDRRATRREQEA